jgi:5-methyltetrahydrofolate--homocysteine methyltransferase
VIESIFSTASKYGFTKEDIIVDALTMTVSAQQDAAKVTLDTIKWCNDDFGARTLLGLSNVSFGLPERKWINATFLAMAAACGLDVAIANPSNEELMAVKFASDVLSGKDPGAKRYISRFAQEKTAQIVEIKDASPQEQISKAVIEGNRDGITAMLEKAVSQGISPSVLVNDVMIPAIRIVGELYEKGQYFLPQLIAGAEAMQTGFSILEPMLGQDAAAKKGKIIMATVKGDIHDIGKNIVSLLLKNNGFDIIDLGKDVSNQAIIEAATAYKPDLIGLSALMTTTMTVMKDAIEAVRASGITCPFMVGGAVVTKEYAASIGAEYAKDGVEAVRIAETLIT